MSYETLEVELDHGRVIPREKVKLPAHGKALLTILSTEPVESAAETNAPTIGQRVAALGGIGEGRHDDLSSNPSHMDDFGR